MIESEEVNIIQFRIKDGFQRFNQLPSFRAVGSTHMYFANRISRIDHEERTIAPDEQLPIGQKRIVKKVAYRILSQVAVQLDKDFRPRARSRSPVRVDSYQVPDRRMRS